MCVCACMHVCFEWKYMQHKPKNCNFSCCECVRVHAVMCSVVHKCTCMCTHMTYICIWVSARVCGSVCGADKESACALPPQLGQSSRLVHTVGSFPLGGRDWGLPDEMLPDWLWNLDLRCLPPHTQTCNIMMHAHNTSHLYYSIKMKREHACAHTETLTKKTQIDPLVWVKGCISKLLNCCFYICTHVGLCAVLCV